MAQKSALMAAWLWLPVFSTGLRTVGRQRFQSKLQRTPTTAGERSLMPQSEIRALAEAVDIAARHAPFHATCLTRSLLLRWRGLHAELRIGVNLASGTVQAHAWVKCAGCAVNDRADIADVIKPFALPPRLAAFSAS